MNADLDPRTQMNSDPEPHNWTLLKTYNYQLQDDSHTVLVFPEFGLDQIRQLANFLRSGAFIFNSVNKLRLSKIDSCFGFTCIVTIFASVNWAWRENVSYGNSLCSEYYRKFFFNMLIQISFCNCQIWRTVF